MSPVLAVAAVSLPLVGLIAWGRFRPVGDEVSARLDALQPDYDFASLPPIIRERDYSADRGPAPEGEAPPVWRFSPMIFVPAWRDFYAELAGRLGDPLRERAP